MRTLAESPSGLVHLVNLTRLMDRANDRPFTRAVTYCGIEVDRQTWTRIRLYDKQINRGLMSKLQVRRRVELPKCERCFGR